MNKTLIFWASSWPACCKDATSALISRELTTLMRSYCVIALKIACYNGVFFLAKNQQAKQANRFVLLMRGI